MILGAVAAIVTPKDIFPYINIPVVSVVWIYDGLTPEEMANRMVTICERGLTTTVNDIEHLESQSYQGVAVIRVYFQPNVKVELAVAQITSITQTMLRVMPPGTLPPSVIKYDVASVPVLTLGLSGEGLNEQDISDLGRNFIRTRLATVQGASLPLPWGGKARQIMVDLDPNALYAKHLSAADVSNALGVQNVILPAGTARVGNLEYVVRTNASPSTLDALNNLPIRASNGALVYIKDVAQVRNGYAVQTNVVRQNGRRSAFLSVLKNGQASTLDIVKAVKKALPRAMADLPAALRVTPLFDQSRVCEFGHQRSAARSLRSGVLDGDDDSAVSGKLAQHTDSLYFDSTFDFDVAVYFVVLGRNHQRNDVGRLGVGGGYFGGRCDGGN